SEAGTMALAVRTAGDPLSMVKAVQTAIARIDKDLALTQIKTLEEVANDSVVRPRFRAVLAATFALAALALSALGVYGVVAFAVSQRVKEFGIRMALGGSGGDVLGLVFRDGLRIAAGGVGVGLAVTAGLSQSLAGLLFGVKPIDPLTFVVVPV